MLNIGLSAAPLFPASAGRPFPGAWHGRLFCPSGDVGSTRHIRRSMDAETADLAEDDLSIDLGQDDQEDEAGEMVVQASVQAA